MTEPLEHAPQLPAVAECIAKHDYGEPITIGQQKIFDALVETMKIRDTHHNLDLRRSLPPLRQTIDEYMKDASRETERRERLEWLVAEFKLYGESFTFTEWETRELRTLLSDVISAHSST